jgi:hypothetical protein
MHTQKDVFHGTPSEENKLQDDFPPLDNFSKTLTLQVVLAMCLQKD